MKKEELDAELKAIDAELAEGNDALRRMTALKKERDAVVVLQGRVEREAAAPGNVVG